MVDRAAIRVKRAGPLIPRHSTALKACKSQPSSRRAPPSPACAGAECHSPSASIPFCCQSRGWLVGFLAGIVACRRKAEPPGASQSKSHRPIGSDACRSRCCRCSIRYKDSQYPATWKHRTVPPVRGTPTANPFPASRPRRPLPDAFSFLCIPLTSTFACVGEKRSRRLAGRRGRRPWCRLTRTSRAGRCSPSTRNGYPMRTLQPRTVSASASQPPSRRGRRGRPAVSQLIVSLACRSRLPQRPGSRSYTALPQDRQE